MRAAPLDEVVRSEYNEGGEDVLLKYIEQDENEMYSIPIESISDV